jgi:hypothetical protein
MRFTLPVGCDYRDYRNFFSSSDTNYFVAIIAKHFAKATTAVISYTK